MVVSSDPAHVLESNVRSYVRHFPVRIAKAQGAKLISEEGKEYLDFFAGAGALNYGHNHPQLKQALIQYLVEDGIVHSLDIATTAKHKFIESFAELILKPRKLDYRLQFCGPTGTNAVEAALKLARKITQRKQVIAFYNGYHGMTLGALSVTTNCYFKRNIPLTSSPYVKFMPYCSQQKGEDKSLLELEAYLLANKDKDELPAAIIVETIQGEGGIRVATSLWLQQVQKLASQYKILLIVDDIQMACGRTGTFFSFETAQLQPDIIVLSKSISAYGLPMSLLLMKPHLDQWLPAEHNGTFRGHNLAFVAAETALKVFWSSNHLTNSIAQKAKLVESKLYELTSEFPEFNFQVRGRGLIWGLESITEPKLAKQIQQLAFHKQLIIETCGESDQVLKILPPVTVSVEELTKGLTTIRKICQHLASESS